MLKGVWLLPLFLLAQGLMGQAGYPGWFWTPPGPGWTVVFAQSGQDALETGAKVLTTYRHSEVVGQYQQLFDDSLDKDTWYNSDYTYGYDSQAAQTLASQLSVADAYSVNLFKKMNVYLIGPKNDQTDIRKDVVEPEDLPTPGWVSELSGLHGDEQKWYGIGNFTLEGSAADAWVQAEEAAVLNLLQSYILHLKVTRSEKSEAQGAKDSSSEIDWFTLHYVMENLQVIGRWEDMANNLAYVAVTVPEGSLREIPVNRSGN